jgi:hypothetical protein
VIALVVFIAIAGAWCYREMVGRSVPTSFPIQSAHVRESGSVGTLDVQRAAGSKLEDLVDLRTFGRFRPVNSLDEAIRAYGKPDRQRFAENQTVFEYVLEPTGRVEFVEELIVDGPSYSLRAFPNNVDAIDALRADVARLVVEYLDLVADKSHVVIENSEGQLEMVVILRGSRVEEISWSSHSR